MPSPRLVMLEELITITSQQISKQVLALAARLADALLDPETMGDGDARAAHQRFKGGTMLKKDGYAFLNMVARQLERTLRLELAQLGPAAKTATTTAAGAMTLVPYEEMDSRVRYGAISRPFDLLYSDALATLNVRLAFLLDREILRPGQNPFRPDVFVMVLHNAWCEFETDADAQGLLLPLIRPELFFEMGALYDALNDTLKRKGGVPPDGQQARARKADSHDASRRQSVKPVATQAELTAQLRQFFASPEAKSVVGSAVSEFVMGSVGGEAIDDMGFDLTLPGLPTMVAAEGGIGPSHDARHGPAPHSMPRPGQAMARQMLLRQPLMNYLAHLQKAGVPPRRRTAALAPDQAQPDQLAAPDDNTGGDAGVEQRSTAGGRRSSDGERAVDDLTLPQLSGHQPGAAGADADAGAAGAAASAKAAPGLPVSLAAIKHNVPQGSLSRADESTIDLLASIFHSVSQDQNIAHEIRELIDFLQIPVLKAALADKDFFFQESHPARRLIDMLSHMGWEHSRGPDDPMLKAMRSSVEKVGREFDQELTVFTDAVAELEASVQAEEQRSQSAMAAPIASALKQEKLAVAARSAKGAVAVRVGSGEVLAVLETFLENRWVAVLTIAYNVEEDKPGAVKNATAAMDDLIWSVRPKVSMEERKVLIGKLPGLLATLNKWLDIIKWQDADRLQFFAELADCHASIVRAPVELSPERQVEIALEVAQQAAERRLELQNMETAPAPPEQDDALLEVATLERGMWLQFSQADGGERKVRLAWISPLRTLFIFSTGARQEAFSMADDALVDLFRGGQVQVAPADGAVRRALSHALAGAAQQNSAGTAASGVAA